MCVYVRVCVCVYVCVHHQRPHCEIKYICLIVVCFQIIFKFLRVEYLLKTESGYLRDAEVT